MFLNIDHLLINQFLQNSSDQVNNLTEYGEKINQFQPTKIKKVYTNPNKFVTFNNPMIYFKQGSYINKKNISQTKIYNQPKFLYKYEFSINNSPANNNIE